MSKGNSSNSDTITITVDKDPFGEGFRLCSGRSIKLEPGLTVLVGCNGAGKTTLLKRIRSEAKNKSIAVHYYDNLRDGGDKGMGEALYHEEFGMAAMMFTASEGEAIGLNLGKMVQKLREFIITGRYRTKYSALEDAFMEVSGNSSFDKNAKNTKSSGACAEAPMSNYRILLMDAVDSGYSVDNVIELKDLFKLIIEDAEKEGKKLFIVISANEYELAKNERCIDVTTGKYITFKDYDDYAKFILETRKKKDNRMNKN